MTDIFKIIFDFKKPKTLILHFSWIAFCLTFVMWFSLPHIKADLMQAFDMTPEKFKALLILNVAMTIPARVVIGMLTDKFGPRYVFGTLLMLAGVASAIFAMAQTYEQLALIRFLMGFIGAGFVIGTRLVGEWYTAREVGLATGIYGGWGNVGSSVAGWVVPALILYVFSGSEDGWRYAIMTVGAIAALYGIVFMKFVRNTPKGSAYFKPKKATGLEVTSRKDFYFLIAMNLPMVLCLGVLAWKLSLPDVALLSTNTVYVSWVVLAALFAYQTYQIYQVNKDMLANGVDELQRYEFKQVGILSYNYLVAFGSELAIASMLTSFLLFNSEGLTVMEASRYYATFTGLNLIARPMGGYLSDKYGRRNMLVILGFGMLASFVGMSLVSTSWSFSGIIGMVMVCSMFVHCSTGAVYAVVPLVKRRLSGQISGMVGAYGNVGSVIFLTAYSMVDTASTFFLIMAGAAAIGAIWSLFLDEPKGQMVEVLDDGTVQLIDVT